MVLCLYKVHRVRHFRYFWNLDTLVKRIIHKQFKGARTYCIINEATPSGMAAMDYFS